MTTTPITAWAPICRNSTHVFQGIDSFKNMLIWWITSNSSIIPGNQSLIELAKKTRNLFFKNTFTPLSLDTKCSSIINCIRLYIDIINFPDTYLGRAYDKIKHDLTPYWVSFSTKHNYIENFVTYAAKCAKFIYYLDSSIHNLGHHLAAKLLIKEIPEDTKYCDFYCEDPTNIGLKRDEFNKLPLTPFGEMIGKNNARTIFYLSGTVTNTLFSLVLLKVNSVVRPIFPIIGLLTSNYLRIATENEVFHAIDSFTTTQNPLDIKGNDWTNLFISHPNATEILRGSHPISWIAPLILTFIHWKVIEI